MNKVYYSERKYITIQHNLFEFGLDNAINPKNSLETLDIGSIEQVIFKKVKINWFISFSRWVFIILTISSIDPISKANEMIVFKLKNGRTRNLSIVKNYLQIKKLLLENKFPFKLKFED